MDIWMHSLKELYSKGAVDKGFTELLLRKTLERWSSGQKNFFSPAAQGWWDTIPHPEKEAEAAHFIIWSKVNASRSCQCWKLRGTGKLLEMIMKGVITSWRSRGKLMENLIYGKKLQDGVAGKGSFILYHVRLIHHPGESVSFEKKRSSLSIRVNVELTSLMSKRKEWE